MKIRSSIYALVKATLTCNEIIWWLFQLLLPRREWIFFNLFFFFAAGSHTRRDTHRKTWHCWSPPTFPALNNWWANQFHFNRSILSHLPSVIVTLSTHDNRSQSDMNTKFSGTTFLCSLWNSIYMLSLMLALDNWISLFKMWLGAGKSFLIPSASAQPKYDPVHKPWLSFYLIMRRYYFDKLLTFMSASDWLATLINGI